MDISIFSFDILRKMNWFECVKCGVEYAINRFNFVLECIIIFQILG